MRVPLILVISLILIITVQTAALASPSSQETISIRGKVVNGTAGFSVPDGLVVLMLITGPDGTLAGTGQTVAAPDGSFAFDDAQRVAGGAYTLSLDYGGVFYGLTLAPDELSGEQVITVYEPTEDAGIIVVDRHVMVVTGFDVTQRMATVTEFVRFANPTDRTLKPNLETARPGMFSFMRFALPPDAANVTVQSNLQGGEIISVGSGFALTAPVPPGEHSVDFAYTFPYQGGEVAYRNSLPQGASIFQILVPDRWEGIEISGLDSRPPVGIQEGVYRAWEGRGIPAGPGVELRIDGLPQPGVLASVGATLSGSSFWLTAIPSAMGAFLLALLALGLVRRYRPAIATDSTLSFSESDMGLSPQRSVIVSALAALDNRYHNGELEEADYLAHRSELVAEALGEYPYEENGEASEDDKLITDEQSGERYA
ncbi:MAG: hypothetical protein F4X66_04165 [Chloroflexi bacterium]|nr:hypothetical protein [Chloroflexota bacterium]MYE39940.1 hypothetical protein [Chloroflexota bacterium]